ncbi:Set1 complex component sdc1 [Tolypocladium ophioglossoides CBS 100239]|uniref:Set1 complex component sdc1 n=1 Tax=Tolypocladium ophioglossoides (strain CBS 100239) TaxID=1163406 RepID=A0A0L0NL52_TOLOC|nr:Set1 complex component sdc1 [Tolypocladium ophioglossoides CBS 100239]
MSDETPKTEPAPQTPAANDAAGSSTPAQQTQPPAPPAPPDIPREDVLMSDAPMGQAASPAPAAFAPSPAPARQGTPAQGSRAASVHPDAGLSLPSEAVPHGDPTRRYLNAKVTSVLLEGMKQLAKDRPHDPLRVLGEYLIQRSKELEGTS